jgi:hypothetical protein
MTFESVAPVVGAGLIAFIGLICASVQSTVVEEERKKLGLPPLSARAAVMAALRVCGRNLRDDPSPTSEAEIENARVGVHLLLTVAAVLALVSFLIPLK